MNSLLFALNHLNYILIFIIDQDCLNMCVAAQLMFDFNLSAPCIANNSEYWKVLQPRLAFSEFSDECEIGEDIDITGHFFMSSFTCVLKLE